MKCPECKTENPDLAYRCANPDCLAQLRTIPRTIAAGVIPESPSGPPSGTTPAGPTDSATWDGTLPSPGALLWDRFRIEEELGRGGMGAVFRAEDEVGGETVAVKVLLPRLSADQAARRRLRAEVQRARSLRHHGVVGVYEYYEDSNLAGFAMELLSGHTLGDHLAGRVGGSPLAGTATPTRLPWVAAIAGQMADALDYIHEVRGLVHRDIKPSNVMLARVDPARSPKSMRVTLLDFGIAHAVGGARATSFGVSGSLGHIAPELQVSGADPTPAADLWSFGMLLYHTLTGVHEPPALDMLTPSGRVSGLPSKVDDAVMACFHRAQTRPARASVVAKTLGAVAEAQRKRAEQDRRQGRERREREEAEKRARREAERQARAKAEHEAKVKAEETARAAEARKAQETVDRLARETAEKTAQLEAEQSAREEARRRAQEETERKAKAETERQARLATERLQRDKAERKARIAADRLEREKAEREERLEAHREAERRAQAEAERREREEADLQERIATAPRPYSASELAELTGESPEAEWERTKSRMGTTIKTVSETLQDGTVSRAVSALEWARAQLFPALSSKARSRDDSGDSAFANWERQKAEEWESRLFLILSVAAVVILFSLVVIIGNLVC